jgi:hypothetical protein
MRACTYVCMHVVVNGARVPQLSEAHFSALFAANCFSTQKICMYAVLVPMYFDFMCVSYYGKHCALDMIPGGMLSRVPSKKFNVFLSPGVTTFDISFY